ncbi:hypothetical protein D3C74_397330 [compost metagenome]
MNALLIEFVSPAHNFGIERLSYRQNMPQTAEIDVLQAGLPRSHQHTESGRCAVPYGNPKPLNGLIPVLRAEAAAPHNVGHSVQPRRKNTIGSSGNPAGISRTPIDVVMAQIQYNLACIIMLDHCSLHMIYAFGLAR